MGITRTSDSSVHMVLKWFNFVYLMYLLLYAYSEALYDCGGFNLSSKIDGY